MRLIRHVSTPVNWSRGLSVASYRKITAHAVQKIHEGIEMACLTHTSIRLQYNNSDLGDQNNGFRRVEMGVVTHIL
jgi:hypothetical protein